MPATVDRRRVTRAERRGHAAPAPAHVVVVHGLAQDDVGVRVEAPGQLVAVVLQVGLDGVAPALERVLRALGAAAEPAARTRPRSGS